MNTNFQFLKGAVTQYGWKFKTSMVQSIFIFFNFGIDDDAIDHIVYCEARFVIVSIPPDALTSPVTLSTGIIGIRSPIG